MNLEADKHLNEDYGAGFEGTNALRDKYIKDTPGQRIQQFKTTMKQKTYQEFEAQHKKMYPTHSAEEIKKAYETYSKYQEETELEEAYGESWVVYDKNTKAQIKPFKSRKGAYDYAAKSGGVVYSAEYYFDHQDDIKSGKLVKEEAVQEAVSKIDVEELLDAAAKMRKEFPQLRKGQSIMIALHNIDPTMYSMAAAKHDAFTVDAKIPDLINFLDPKYYKESSDLEEAINIRDYMATSEKSQFGGYTPIVVDKKGKVMYSGQASYNTPDEAKDHAENYLKQYARGISDPRVPLRGTYVKEGRFFNSRDYMATSEKSQFGGYRPKVVDKDGKTMYLSQALYNTPDEAKDHAEEYLKQYSRGISEPRVPVKGTYVKEEAEITVAQRRQMKIVALATGSTDLDSIYEYVSTQPTEYTSLVDLKESFNKYINNL